MTAAAVADATTRHTSTDPLFGSRPSPAELRVLNLLPTDLSKRQIAAELHLSLNTVKSHTRRLYLRLGVRDRDDAVAVARHHGFLRSHEAHRSPEHA